MEPIIAYSAYWHAESDTGRLFLKLQNEESVELHIDSPGELASLCDMLQRYPQVAYDTERKLIATGWLKPGKRYVSA
jgi:hypothetical protein